MAAPIATLAIRITGELAELRKTFQDATKEVSSFQTKISNTARTIATTLGVGFSVGAVTSFITRITEAAGEVVDLSHKLGISTEAVQKLNFIAGQTGTTVEALGNAVFRLGANVAGGDSSTAKAFHRLGLSLTDLRALAPERQFDEVVSAVGRLSSAQERNLALTEIFGRRQAGEIAKIVDEYERLRDTAPAAGDASVQALERAGDAAARAKAQFTATATQGFGQLVVWAEKAQFWVDALADKTGEILRQGPGVEGTFWRWASSLEGVESKAKASADELARLQRTALANAPQISQPALGPTGPTDAEGFAAIEREIARDAKFANEQLALQRDEWQKNLDAAKAWEEGYQRYQKTLATTDTLTRALTRTNVTALVAQSQLRDSVSQSADIWLLQQRVASSTAQVFGGELIPQLSQSTIALAGLGGWTRQTTIDLGELSGSLSNLAQVAGGSFGTIARSLSTLVTSFDTAQKSWGAFTKGLDAFKGGGVKDILSGISSLASGIFGITSAAIAAGRALFNLFDRDKGRDLVEVFAGGFGGFDELHKELLKLGDAGEDLWIKLTQGVGRNNPEQAQRVIAEVEQALARWKSQQDEASVSTEAGARSTIETTAEAVTALEQLNERIATNTGIWKQWSVDVTASISDVAQSLRALTLPTPSVGGVSGVTPGFGGTEAGEQFITVNVGEDAIVRAAVRGMPRRFTLEGR